MPVDAPSAALVAARWCSMAGGFSKYKGVTLSPDVGFSPSKLFDEGLLVLNVNGKQHVIQTPFGGGEGEDLRVLQGQEAANALYGGGNDVRSMVQEAMRTAKDGGLVRGGGKATKGRGRGKMV